MRIAIVGGLDRAARELEDIARARGHQLEVHTGTIAGPASSASLRALVARAELVIVLTDINSHNGVRMARRQARISRRPVRLLRRLGPSQFEALVRALGTATALPSCI